MRRNLFARALFVSLIVLLISACHRQYSFEQEKVELESLGEELWKVWHKDAQRAAERADEKSAMLVEQHNAFVDAVDAVAPEPELSAINEFMANLLTLVDDGIVPGLTRKLIVVFEEAMADAALLAALAAPTGPDAESFVSADVAPNLLGYITGYPGLVPLLRFKTRIMLENDGFTDEGARTFDEPAGISDLVRVLANELAAVDDPSDEPLAVTIRDMLLVEDAAYEPADNPRPAFVALFDDRGYPLASRNADGSLVYPFTDTDGDGRADIDVDGEFILQGGESVAVRPFATSSEASIDEPVTRDTFGRALGTGGEVFEYVDLHRTALGFLMRQQHRLSSQDALYDMLQAFRTIMGQKQVYADEIGGYEGYAQEQPLMDMSDALVYTIDTPALPDLLEGTSELANRHPDVLARLFWAFDNMGDILDENPDAGMTDEQTMVYDLLPFLAELVQDQALWADVMVALRSPIMRRSGDAYGTLLSFRDSDSLPVLDGPYDRCFQNCKSNFEIGTASRFDCIRGCPMAEIFDEPMDFAAPESFETISNFQKMQYLLRDATGKEYTMDIENAAINGDPLPPVPPLMRLPAAGEAFLNAIAGNLNLADHVPPEMWASDLGELLALFGLDEDNVATMISTISGLFGAHLDVVPTPDQITRLFNQPDIKFETTEGSVDVLLDPADPTCHDGYVMSQHFAYILFQAEASGAIDALYPLAKAFSDHGRADLLLKMMIVMHDHYAGDKSHYRTVLGAQSPMKAANMRSYEPAMLKIFQEGELFDALTDFAVAQDEVEQATGIPMAEALRQVLARGLQQGYSNRRGETWVNINDGRTVSNATALHHIFAAMDEASKRLDADPQAREKLDDAVGAIAKIMVGTTREPGGPPRFADPGSIVFTAHATKYLADKAREKQQSGELSPWLQDDVLTSIEEFWRSRTLAAILDLADEALADPSDKEVVDAFTNYLLGNSEGQTQTLVAIHQLLVQSIARDRWLPIAQFLARVIDPDRQWQTAPYGPVSLVTLTALLLKKTLDADPDNTGIFLIHRGLKRPAYQDAPFTTIIDVIARYLSLNPAADTFETPDDYRHFYSEMASYLGDDVHGMERLYELVDRRIKPAAAPAE